MMADARQSPRTLPTFRYFQSDGFGIGYRRVLRRGGFGLIGGVILFVMAVVAIAAPWITVDPNYQTSTILSGPSFDHWFGTDHLGRDQFARIVWGSRVTLMVVVIAVGLSLTLGTFVGIVSGYFGGWFDVLFQRVVDTLIAFPGIVLAMAAIAAFQASLLTIAIVVGIIRFPNTSRVVRGATMSVRESEYVEAAQSMGATNTRILMRHILPNVRAPIIVMGTVLVGSIVLIESSLSFLGFGLPPPDPTWGQMLSGAGRVFMLTNPWMAIIPGTAITLIVLASNLFGDSLRDILDPRL